MAACCSTLGGSTLRLVSLTTAGRAHSRQLAARCRGMRWISWRTLADLAMLQMVPARAGAIMATAMEAAATQLLDLLLLLVPALLLLLLPVLRHTPMER